jgi:hypothetical protein
MVINVWDINPESLLAIAKRKWLPLILKSKHSARHLSSLSLRAKTYRFLERGLK